MISPTHPELPVVGVAEVHLRTAELDRSVRFYGVVLGFPLVRTEPAPRRYVFAAGGTLVVLEEASAPASGPSSVAQIVLGLPKPEQLEGARRRLLSAGIPVSSVEERAFARGFRFRDPTTGVFFQLAAPIRAFVEADRHGDPEPTPSAKELLAGR